MYPTPHSAVSDSFLHLCYLQYPFAWEGAEVWESVRGRLFAQIFPVKECTMSVPVVGFPDNDFLRHQEACACAHKPVVGCVGVVEATVDWLRVSSLVLVCRPYSS